MSKFFIESGKGDLSFHCPACGHCHGITSSWQVTGSEDSPTVRPSVLVRSGHYASHGKDHPCWCDFNAERVAKGEEPSKFNCTICHLFITDGNIQYLDDCTHGLAGKTVPMEDI